MSIQFKPEPEAEKYYEKNAKYFVECIKKKLLDGEQVALRALKELDQIMEKQGEQ